MAYNPNKISAAEAMSQARLKRDNRRRNKWIIIGIVAVVITILIVIVSMQMVNHNKIEQAKAYITQVEINTTQALHEFDDNDDWDNDGVLNGEESALKTNPRNEDTDGDGISDGDELKLGTDPTDPDTDKDGMLDGFELMAGTDPLNKMTDGITPDGDRRVTITRIFGEAEAKITGCPNVADLTIERLDLLSINANSSIVTHAYDIYSDYSFDELTVSFRVNADELKKRNITVDDLTVLRFDADSKQYIKVQSTGDSSAGTVSAKLDGLGIYTVGVERTANLEPTTRIAFLIDNSGSMYDTFSGYDVEFKRVDFVNDLIEKCDGDYMFMASKFTATYTRLQTFTKDKKVMSQAIGKIKTDKETFNGTHSQTALEKCIAEFGADSSKKFRDIIVFLTDGESDEPNPKTLEQLTALANGKDITILTVGLGNAIDRTWLHKLAAQTGGKYYSASEANALTDVYKQIQTSLDYDMVSYNDNEDKIQGYSLYNTGFKPEVNGFSFRNFRTTSSPSVDFGMAVFARDWYLGSLKLSLGKVSPKEQSSISYSADGYDLTGTKLENDLKVHKTLGVIAPTVFAADFAEAKDYLDFSSKGDVLKADSRTLTKARKAGWEVSEYPMESSTLSWNRVEFLSLDVAAASDKIAEAYAPWEAQLLRALHTLNALQWTDEEYEFNLTGGDEGFERLKQLLAEGVPVVTTIDDTHTVNAIGLIQDSTAHRKYILQVYDPAYPGKTKEIYLTRSPIASCTISDGKAVVDSTAFEYHATYEGKQVGICFSDVKY